MNVRSSILPLTKRYPTDILSQKLRILRVKLYTDNIFADYTSVRDNKCAQIYTDRDVFLHVFPMKPKAGAGDSVGNVVKDIGIMNEINCDNAM